MMSNQYDGLENVWKKLAANFFSADLKLGERMMTQGEKDIVSWSVLLLVVILMKRNIVNANDDHDHDYQE